MKGMAFAEPDKGKPHSPDNSMPYNRFAGILGTGGVKPAGRREKRRQQLLVQPDYDERNALEHGDVPICLKAFSSSL
jgi:hypothetical protein